MEFSFGEHVLDLNLRELRRGAELVALEPQVFDLLVYLVQNRDRRRQQGRPVGGGMGRSNRCRVDAEQPHQTLRRAVGDSGDTQWSIRTVSRKGLRFVGVVEETGTAVMPPRPLPTLSEKPSIAVLPFANISADSEQEYFSDGMVEEIITALSRIRWL